MSMKWLFVTIMTAFTVLSIFLLADIIFMGVVALFISIFNSDLAIQYFKNGVSLLFGIEFVLTLYALIKNKSKK